MARANTGFLVDPIISEDIISGDNTGQTCVGRCSKTVARGTICSKCNAPCHPGCVNNHECKAEDETEDLGLRGLSRQRSNSGNTNKKYEGI